MAQTFDFKEFAKNWKSPVVARSQVKEFSGGLLHPRTLANLDCQGKGPPSIQFGRKIGYPVDALVKWMQERFEEGRA